MAAFAFERCAATHYVKKGRHEKSPKHKKYGLELVLKARRRHRE